MVLTAGCPRCLVPVVDGRCADHGEVPALWRADEASYDAFGAVLHRAGGFPTYLTWPVSPGWSVTDAAVVVEQPPGPGPERVRATMTCTSGPSELDGPVDVVVVAEEAGTGLGARCAGIRYADPGPEVAAAMADGSPSFRVRTGWTQVALWSLPGASDPVDASADWADERSEDRVWDRSVLVGEADGRWLWMVLRPASALLLLRDGWTLRDAGSAGPETLDLTYGGPRPDW